MLEQMTLPHRQIFRFCFSILLCVCSVAIQVGHAGTLDPAATGLLIICTGLGTKSIDGFMAAHKEYSGTLKLGEGKGASQFDQTLECK